MKRKHLLEVSLTPRQMQVLHLILNGLSNREIADSLHLSRGTVETHRYRVMTQLEARNIAQLFRRVVELRLLPGYARHVSK
jgi:DNA-binding CsgD family transcriptional regulator